MNASAVSVQKHNVDADVVGCFIEVSSPFLRVLKCTA